MPKQGLYTSSSGAEKLHFTLDYVLKITITQSQPTIPYNNIIHIALDNIRTPYTPGVGPKAY